jgi:glycosyltransferase involved in cell wall biosynthesis
MSNPVVAVLATSEPRRDPRVRRVSRALAEQGYSVTVVATNVEVDDPSESLDNYQVLRTRLPQKFDVDEMAMIEAACPPAAAILRQCDPRVMEEAAPFRIKSRLHRVAQRYGRAIWRRCLRPILGLNANPVGAIHQIRSMMIVNRELYRAALALRPEVAHCNDLDTLLAGFMLKETLGCRLVFDAHEIYPEQLPTHMRSDIWHRFYTNLERALLPHTDARMTVCDSIGKYFRQVYGSGPVLTLRNVPAAGLQPPADVLARRNRPRRILYHGAYFPYRGLDEVIAAARWVDDAQFVFRGIGGHLPVLERLVAKYRLGDKVVFAPPVGVDDLIPTAADCDIGLNPFISVCKNTEYALPNKFFEYMMAGLALASADLVEMRGITHQLGNGILFDSTDPRQIANALNELLADPERLDGCRRNSYEAARASYNWESEQTKLIDEYQRLGLRQREMSNAS